MPVETIEFADANDEQVTVTLRGEPDAVIKALCSGLPREALLQLRDAFEAELAKRKGDA